MSKFSLKVTHGKAKLLNTKSKVSRSSSTNNNAKPNGEDLAADISEVRDIEPLPEQFDKLTPPVASTSSSNKGGGKFKSSRMQSKPASSVRESADENSFDFTLAASDDDFSKGEISTESSDESSGTSSYGSGSEQMPDSSDDGPTRGGRCTPTIMLSRDEVRERMKANPDIQLLVHELAEDKVKDELRKLGVLGSTGLYKKTKHLKTKGRISSRGNQVKQTNKFLSSPQFTRSSKVQGLTKNLNNKPTGRELVKSPSDTTLYTPALKQGRGSRSDADWLINQISNFVESIRLETSGRKGERSDLDR